MAKLSNVSNARLILESVLDLGNLLTDEARDERLARALVLLGSDATLVETMVNHNEAQRTNKKG
jgi:hypothetical protein